MVPARLVGASSLLPPKCRNHQEANFILFPVCFVVDVDDATCILDRVIRIHRACSLFLNTPTQYRFFQPVDIAMPFLAPRPSICSPQVTVMLLTMTSSETHALLQVSYHDNTLDPCGVTRAK
jgi:hypothetical protein